MPSLTAADEHLRSVDHVLRRLIDDRGPIDPEADRRGSRPDAYQALARAIVGQQLSTKAAASIWARVTELFGGDTPSPSKLLGIEGSELREAGLSWSKVGFLKDLAERHRFTLKISGAGKPVQFDGVRVEDVPWAMSREVDLFNSCDIGIYPLDDDDWARGKCGFKAIQFMACGVPVVA